jgi:Immunoglobulin I-set domain
MINGDRYRIVTNEQKSSLLIKSVMQEDFGFYVCKAMNDAGEVTTRAKLIESSKAFMTAEEIEENQKRIEKKLAKKTKMIRKASITAGNTTSSVNVEATVKSAKNSSKSSKKTKSESVDVAASFKTKTKKAPKTERREDISSELTITKTENIIVQEIEETFITEVQRTTCEKKINITGLKDLSDLKTSQEVNEIMKKLEVKSFTSGESSLRELATIAYMVQKGLPVKEIEKLFQANLFPELQTPESQCALVQLLERRGHATLVSEVLSEQSETEIDENYVASAGFRAFMKMIAMKKENVEEIVLSISPEDFTAGNWKHEAKEV